MTRRFQDWGGRGQEIPPVVKAVAVVVGAFLVTGLLYFAAQQAMNVASRRVETKYAPRYSAYDENAADKASGPFAPTFAGPMNAPQQYGVPTASGGGNVGGVMRFAQAAPATPPSLPPPTTANRDGFTNDGERQTGRTRVKGLRGTLSTLKQYDSASLWTGVDLIQQARQAEETAVEQSASGSVTLQEGGSDTGRFSDADEAQAVRLRVSRKILGELEAMNAEVALTTHPGRFPEPLHDGAEAVGGAMRTYLETARMAVARPHEASVLKARAGRELARVEELIRAMEPITGGASAAN